MEKTVSEPKSSFFDDSDPKPAFEFAKPGPSHQKDIKTPPILQTFLTCKDSFSGTSQKGCFSLHHRAIAFNKGQFSTTPDSILDISNSRLGDLKPSQTTVVYGFIITKNGSSFEFHFDEKESAESWKDTLKSICVLKNFHEEYTAHKVIGKGSFAKVYLVESKTNGKKYAVKAFSKDALEKTNKTNAKVTMLNEIDIMRTLDHENIIKLHQVHESDNSIYLVMELIEGKSLQEPLAKSTLKKDFTNQQVVEMIRSILDALSYIASKGIMHRDLKPDNILIDKNGKIKIADFGLATFIDVPEYIFKKCGTPGYIAPEVFKFDAKVPATNYDDHCDVFSAGAILYYMLFNCPFFNGTTAAEVLQLNREYTEQLAKEFVTKETNNPLRKLNKDGLDLALKLLEFDQKKRISASQALTHSYFEPAIVNKPPIKIGKESLHKHSRSFCTPVKVIHAEEKSPASPKIISIEKTGSQTPRTKNSIGRRYTEKDSLYLDVGKPEMTGKVDTLAAGSALNSLLMRSNSNGNGTSKNNSISAFAKRGVSPDHEGKGEGKTPKGRNGVGRDKSILKAAIFNNMQKNSDMNGESASATTKEDNKKKPERKLERRHTDNNLVKALQFDFDGDDGSGPESVDDTDKEGSQINQKIETMKNESVLRQPGKFMRSSTKIVYDFQ